MLRRVKLNGLVICFLLVTAGVITATAVCAVLKLEQLRELPELRYGYIDKTGKLVIAPQFAWAGTSRISKEPKRTGALI